MAHNLPRPVLVPPATPPPQLNPPASSPPPGLVIPPFKGENPSFVQQRNGRDSDTINIKQPKQKKYLYFNTWCFLQDWNESRLTFSHSFPPQHFRSDNKVVTSGAALPVSPRRQVALHPPKKGVKPTVNIDVNELAIPAFSEVAFYHSILYQDD